jgi:RNA polymerase sigma-70 factor (ECF subfamily)
VAPAAQQRVQASADLAAWLSDELAAARARWPTIVLDREVFIDYLAHWISVAMAADAELRQCSLSEIYIGCACSRGDAIALALFEQAYMSEVDAALAHMRLAREMVDEIKQLVREKLFVAQNGEPARITNYAGHGQLLGLVRVLAVRAAVDLLRRCKREQLLTHARADVPAPGLDPELAHLQQRYQAHFKDAFELAVKALSSRERNLIRYQLVDGLNVDQIGALYGTHRATAARWVKAAREELARRTRNELCKRLALSAEEVEGLIRWVQSQMELSIQRIFKSGET